ncbi:MAG: metal ABC transporter solute-binding protein, Zn/Mn family [Campylobacter sp.]
MRKILTFLFLGALALMAKPMVSVSILPQEFFVKQIAGDTLDVNVLVGAGADPHTYEPKPKQMVNLENSELYFAIGIEFEETWLDKFSKTYPKLKIIQTQNGVEKMKFQGHHHHHHDDDEHEGPHHGHGEHEAHHDHHHGEFDPHIWLDPILVKIQAKNILDALAMQFPQNKALYNQNYEKFILSLDKLDSDIKNMLKDVKNRDFIVYHPSWGYFAKRYDLDQIAIEIEGKEPKPAQLSKIIEEAKEHGTKVIFVAPQFSKKAAETIAKEANARVVEIDQLSRDWETQMRKTAEIFSKSL